MLIPLGLYGAVVAALLIAELREDIRAQYLFKPLAALGFVLIALMCGALDHLYGQIILAGLVACALGDVFLLARKSEALFTLGMGAFAIGHLAYLSAFITEQSNEMSGLIILTSALPIFVGAGFYSWLKPHLPKTLIWPVAIYTLIIILMVVRSLGLEVTGVLWLVPIAAILFAVSDMFVARDRFVKPGPKNAFAITPLYFGAQALFALSVQV